MTIKTHNKLYNKIVNKIERIREISDTQEQKEMLLKGASPLMRRIIEASLASQKNNDKN